MPWPCLSALKFEGRPHSKRHMPAWQARLIPSSWQSAMVPDSFLKPFPVNMSMIQQFSCCILTRLIKVSMSEERPSYPLVSVSSPTQAEIAQEVLTSKQRALFDALFFFALSFVMHCICVTLYFPFLPSALFSSF